MKRWILVGWMVTLVATGCGKSGGGDDDDDNQSPTPSPTGSQPVANAGPDWNPLAGIDVPLIGTASQNADTYLWEQTAGDTLTIRNEDQATAYVTVPAGAAAATSYTFTLTVTNAAQDTDTDDTTITVIDPVFEDFLAGINDTNQLNTTEGIAFDSEGLWVGSNEGFVSLFDSSGAFVRSEAVGANIIGVNFNGPGSLVVAVVGNQSVEILDTVNGGTTLVTDQDNLGGNLGSVNYVLPDKDGNIFITNRTGGTVWRYDANDGQTRVFLNGLPNPNALAFGPEDDKIYVGTNDDVLRVPINPDGSAGTPETYVANVGGEVDGLVFDSGLNLWMGPFGNDLKVAPYVATGSTTITREFLNPAAGYDRFINPSFGWGAYGNTTFYWTNLGDQSVGRLDVGVTKLVPPLLAPQTP